MADRRDIRSRTTQRNPSHTELGTRPVRSGVRTDAGRQRRVSGNARSAAADARGTAGSSRSVPRRSVQQSQRSGTSRGSSSLRRTSRQELLKSLPEIEKAPKIEKTLKIEEAPEPEAPAVGDEPQLDQDQPELVSKSVGELRREERVKRLRRSSRRYAMRFIAIIGVFVALVAGWAALYNSPAFSIESVQVNGVEHLTSDEMAQLAAVPSGSTLLRVDTNTIASRVKQSSWVEDVSINRVFPSTLEINVTERSVLAIVEMPNKTGTATKSWAIADDGIWLMPIPDLGTEAAQTTSSKIYEDAENVVHIVDLPYGTQAEIGQECADDTVNNALTILQDMTTELAGQVTKISAASIAETSLFLESGVEIAFGSAEDIRDKERTVLKIMEDNPDGVAYINVRIVENPTWRSL